MNRIGDISNTQLKEEIESGKRSKPSGEMTEIEMLELVELIEKEGGIAKLKGSTLQTNRADLRNKYVGEYVLRKITM